MLLIVPQSQRNMHLQTLAAIAKMFHNCSIRQQLHDAETAEDILGIFDSDSSSVRAGGEN